MDFQDFPMSLGNLGVETDHPPKMCAGLALQIGARTMQTKSGEPPFSHTTCFSQRSQDAFATYLWP